MILRAQGWTRKIWGLWPSLAVLSLFLMGSVLPTSVLSAGERGSRSKVEASEEESADEESEAETEEASDAETEKASDAETEKAAVTKKRGQATVTERDGESDDRVTPLSLRNLRRAGHETEESEEETDEIRSVDAVVPDKDFDYGAEMKSLQKRLADLEAASKKKEGADKKPAGGDDKKAGTAAKVEEWLDTSTEKWTTKMGGQLQMDYINWADASPAIVGDQDYFEFRRVRLIAEGQGYGVFDFRLQMSLEQEQISETNTQTAPVVKDAYFSINEIPWLGRVRAGNFFVPFGLEQVTNDANNIFMERSLPTQGVFTADREVGIASYNHTEDYRFGWATGAFFDSISEASKQRIDDNQGLRVSGRVTYLPYYDEPSNGRYLWHTGAGVLYTRDQDHLARFRARPQIHLGPRLIDSGNIAADSYTTGNIESAIVWGSLSVQSEAYLCAVDQTNGDSNVIGGSYAYMSYFLTGENRIYERFGQHGAQFARSAPAENMYWVRGCHGLGAWEAKARWSYLDLHSLGSGAYEDFTAGMNWYWSDKVRVVFDWIHPFTTSTTTFGAVQADILAMRLDIVW